MSSQPSLLDLPVGRTKKRGQVIASSVEAYQRTAKDTRIATVISELQTYAIEYCHKPTSAELTRWYQTRTVASVDRQTWTTDLLYVRRGLSDASAKGLVEHAGKRICTVAGTLAVTWKVRSR